MSDNSVSFGKKEGGGFLKSTIGSAINVGATIGAGAAVGAGVGKLASLTPYKPSAADLNFQYKDMFERAVRVKEPPSYIKDAGDEFVKLFKEGRTAHVTDSINNAALLKGQQIEKLINDIAISASNNPLLKKMKGVNDEQIQQQVKKILKDKSGEKLTNEQMVEGLANKLQRLSEWMGKRKPSNMDELSTQFAEKAGSNPRIKELAEKGAKYLRNKSIIGVGIAVGVLGALTLNILKTYGILKLPKFGKKQAQAPAQGQA